jgi:hypothetical protein
MRLCAAAAFAAMLLVAAPVAHGAQEESAAAAAARPAIVAVWALADGDTPLTRARVRVMKDGRRIRPVRRGRELTSAKGVSLLRLKRVPRRFTVEVTPRRGLRGRLRAVVRNYHSGRVVHVNPVTTLIANLAAQRRRGRPIGLRIARREVLDALRIPDWHDHTDLRHSDRYFDGDAYLRAARRAGGVAALNRALLRRALDDEWRAFHNRRRPARAAAIDWLKLVTDPAALIEEVFKSLGELAGETAVHVAAGKAGETALGWVLTLFGLGDTGALTKADLDQVHEALDAIGKQLTEVKGQVNRAEFNDLVHKTDDSIARIDHASGQLALLANMDPKDPTKAAYTRTIIDYIGEKLTDVPEILDRSLGSTAPLADNLLISASRTQSTRDRFFDAKDSAAVKSVYDYYAAWQARLAILLTEYFHAKPGVYSPGVVQSEVAKFERYVTTQAAYLKPPVPAKTVMDTQANMMWMRDSTASTFRRLSDMVALYSGGQWRLTEGAESTWIPGLPFGNWAMPDTANMNTLLSDRRGRDGVDYLVDAAGISRQVLQAGIAHVFVRDTFRFGVIESIPRFWRMRFNLYDLRGAHLADATNVDFSNPSAWRAAFDGYQAPILFRRVLGPGEEYWWR